MEFYLMDLLVFVNIYCFVWAQTTNYEMTTQMSGNTEFVVQEMTQTPKSSDNQTEYENLTTTQSYDLISNNWNSIDLVSMNNTFNNMTTIREFTERTTQSVETKPTTLPPNEENQTLVIDFGNTNSSSKSINELQRQQSIDLQTTTTTPTTTLFNTIDSNESTVTPLSLTTNITSIFNYILGKSPKALNLSNNEINDYSLSPMTDANETLLLKTTNLVEVSTQSIPIVEYSSMDNISNENIPHSSQQMSSFFELTKTTEFNEINSRQTTQTTETSTHKPNADTTQGIQTTTFNTYIEPNPRVSEGESESAQAVHTTHSTHSEQSPQTTENAINSSESQTVSNNLYFPNLFKTSETPINQNSENPTQYAEITQNSNLNASESSSTAYSTASVDTLIGFTSNSSEAEFHNRVTTISTESQTTPVLINSFETIQMIRHESNVSTQTETQQSITTTPSTSTILMREISESHRESKSETMETKLIENSQSSSTQTIIEPKPTTQLLSETTQTISSLSEAEAGKLTASPTLHSQSPDVQTESQITQTNNESNARNGDSDHSVNLKTTLKQPLITDHNFKTTEYLKPMTTSTPLESNISSITITLPNIKYISSISKEDMVNIVTITLVAKNIDIYRWVSVYDPILRNFTCDSIDLMRNWCSIERFVYLSPSPLVVNNHLILNFLIDYHLDNDLNILHVYSGPLIVESLKNSTSSLEALLGMKVMSLQTNLGTMVVKPLDNSPERLAKFELLVFIFTVVMFICTALLCLAVICSCAKRKSVDMNQIQISNTGRLQTAINGGFDLNSASNILRDENQENKLNHNVINLDGWVAPIEQVDSEKITKYENLQDTKL